MATNRKQVLVLAADVWACGLERIVKPYSKFAGKDNGGIDFTVWDLKKRDKVYDFELAMFDAVMFQRPCFEEHANIMRKLKAAGKKVVVEVDDRLDCVSRTNPAYQVFKPGGAAVKNFFDCLSLADALSVSTPELAAIYSPKLRTKHVEYFSNTVDMSDPVYLKPSLRNQYPTDQVNIMWSGSSSHWDSLLEVKSAIEQVIPMYPNARFLVGGNQQFSELFQLPKEQNIWIPGVDIAEYPTMPSHADVFIVPVELNPFNDAKSELKVLECGVWGVPSICSAAAPYKRFNELSGGGNILIKGNRCDRWIKAIREMIENTDMRKEKSALTLKAIAEHYSLVTENEKRLAFWHKVLGT